MTEIVIFPEMEIAGAEALQESRMQGMDETGQAVAVYVAMQVIMELAIERAKNKVIH
jgi:hypothetical protein